MDLKNSKVFGEISITIPQNGCSDLKNQQIVRDRIAIVQRGGCVFQKKAEMAQKAGAIGLIIMGLFLII